MGVSYTIRVRDSSYTMAIVNIAPGLILVTVELSGHFLNYPHMRRRREKAHYLASATWYLSGAGIH
jgi:hypothetical protein